MYFIVDTYFFQNIALDLEIVGYEFIVHVDCDLVSDSIFAEKLVGLLFVNEGIRVGLIEGCIFGDGFEVLFHGDKSVLKLCDA